MTLGTEHALEIHQTVEEDGPDYDIGASPILTRDESGREIILAGQKSGMVYALDPSNNGALIWEQR